MKLKDITDILEELAPISSQESYDNSGWIVGNPFTEFKQALICLDCTEAVVEEAIEKNCNLIISHHPIVFKGLKSLTGKNYIERVVMKAIKNDISIYSSHTNLDNYRFGVNHKIASLLGIKSPKILAPSTNTLLKLSVFVPSSQEHKEAVRKAICDAGAGKIGDYSDCSFQSSGMGSFMANESADPFVGKAGELHYESEVKLEAIVSSHLKNKVIHAMIEAHPYEEVAYDLVPLVNSNLYEGAGGFGELENEMSEIEFLTHLKTTFNCGAIRHTSLLNKPIKRVAWCGGSGSFLLKNAMAQRADIFITGDFKYHEFFNAENQLIIADIGHFESEQFTIELIRDLIRKKIPTFAPCLTENNTNPVKYF